MKINSLMLAVLIIMIAVMALIHYYHKLRDKIDKKTIFTKKYLFNIHQRVLILALGISYILFILYESPNYTFSLNSAMRPYSTILFVSVMFFLLAFMSRNNWKQKIKILLLLSVLVFMYFKTADQLDSFYSISKKRATLILIKNSLSFVNFWTYYHLGKILMLNIFAIFTFYAVNKTVDGIELKDS